MSGQLGRGSMGCAVPPTAAMHAFSFDDKNPADNHTIAAAFVAVC